MAGRVSHKKMVTQALLVLDVALLADLSPNRPLTVTINVTLETFENEEHR